MMRKVHAARRCDGAEPLELDVQADPAAVSAGEAQDLQEMAGNLFKAARTLSEDLRSKRDKIYEKVTQLNTELKLGEKTL